MISCGILGVLASTGVGRSAFEVFEPIRGIRRGWGDESWAPGCQTTRFANAFFFEFV